MHLIHGVFKKLIDVWTKPLISNGSCRFKSQKAKPIVSKRKWSQFNRNLVSQKLPQMFHRTMRSIEQHGAYYKAIEAYLFVTTMYPLLKRVLPTRYYSHHMLLVTGLKAILRRSISMEQLDQAIVRSNQVCVGVSITIWQA